MRALEAPATMAMANHCSTGNKGGSKGYQHLATAAAVEAVAVAEPEVAKQARGVKGAGEGRGDRASKDSDNKTSMRRGNCQYKWGGNIKHNSKGRDNRSLRQHYRHRQQRWSSYTWSRSTQQTRYMVGYRW